jgi:acetylornithine deacetylase
MTFRLKENNNIWAFNKHLTLQNLLYFKFAHDTVRPIKPYQDPFKAIIENDKLYGLGSNDAGGCLVSLLATFVHFYDLQI